MSLTIRVRGFTLVELITVLILVGVLAVAALPRFVDKSVFETRGFRDETIALLRYAQKAAIVQRRTVCVFLNTDPVTVSIAAAADSTNCDTPLVLPNTPRDGANLTPSVTDFKFSGLGATNQGANITIAVSGASDITIDKVTGYAY